MAKYTTKQWNALSSQQQYMQRGRIPSRRPQITDLKKTLKPRNRTNNKNFSAKSGAVVPGRTGVGGFASEQAAGTSGGSAAYANEEIAREYKNIDGCEVAVRSKIKYSDDSEIWMTWLEPGDSRITEVS